MDLNLLSLFAAAAESTTFAEAARKLEVPRSSISRGVAALEAALGVQLFQRTTRRVGLTTPGSVLYAQIAPQLAALAGAITSVPETEREPSGAIKLSAPIDIGGIVLPPILASFVTRYRDIQIDVRLANRRVDLGAEGFDVALRVATARMPSSSLVARRLTPLEMQLYAAPVYLARNGAPRTARELADHDWVQFGSGKLPPPFPTPTRRARVGGDDIHFVCQAVLAGIGIGLLPTFLCDAYVRDGHLVRVLPRLRGVSATLHFVHAPARHVPRKIAALRDYLIDHFASHPLAPRQG